MASNETAVEPVVEETDDGVDLSVIVDGSRMKVEELLAQFSPDAVQRLTRDPNVASTVINWLLPAIPAILEAAHVALTSSKAAFELSSEAMDMAGVDTTSPLMTTRTDFEELTMILASLFDVSQARAILIPAEMSQRAMELLSRIGAAYALAASTDETGRPELPPAVLLPMEPQPQPQPQPQSQPQPQLPAEGIIASADGQSPVSVQPTAAVSETEPESAAVQPAASSSEPPAEPGPQSPGS